MRDAGAEGGVGRGDVPPGHRVAVRAASFGVLAVLLALLACAAWGAASTYRADVAVKRATEASLAIEQARQALAAIRAVRRAGGAPEEAARTQHQEATLRMTAALERARVFSEPAYRLLIDELLARQAQYVRLAGAAFGETGAESVPTRGDPARSEGAFAGLEAALEQAADRFRNEALNLLRVLVSIQTTVFVGGPLFFGLGLLLIGVIWRMQRRLQREGTSQALREAYGAAASEGRFRGVVEHGAEAVLICAGPGQVTYQNRAVAAWGYAEDSLVGTSVLTLVHPDDRAALRAWWEQLRPVGAGEGRAVLPVRLRDGTGAWRAAEIEGVNLLQDAAVAGVVLTVRDAGVGRPEGARVPEGASLDPVTRLPNAALLRDRLGQALVRAARRKDQVAVLSVGLDGLDAAGAHGDAAVMEAATRILACVRPQDSVARTGPATFVVVREAVERAADAVAVAEAIVAPFSRKVGAAGEEQAIAVRVGVVLGDPRRDHVEDLLRDAGLAMQQVPLGAPVRHVVFGAGAPSDRLDRVELESDLRSALRRHEGAAWPEFEVHFQPIVALGPATVRGVEALMRWRHPVHGMVAPRDFIPAAEATGLIVPLGQWALESACRQVVAWQQRLRFEPPLTLSVNLSALQFQQPGLVADVSRALAGAGLGADCLRLEITEGIIMRDTDASLRTLWALKELGVTLAIDDFGSGYSALSFLKLLPLGLLKVDGAFVSGIGRDAEDTSIVRAVLALAKSLGWGVTAEGIETAEQAALLGAWGCDFGQGYHFGRPLDAAETDAVLVAAVSSGRLAGAG